MKAYPDVYIFFSQLKKLWRNDLKHFKIVYTYLHANVFTKA